MNKKDETLTPEEVANSISIGPKKHGKPTKDQVEKITRKKYPKNSTRKKNRAKQLLCGRERHVRTEKEIQAIAERLKVYADPREIWSMEDFLKVERLDPVVLRNYAAKYPYFEEAYQIALTAIAANREIGALIRKIDGGYCARNQASYSYLWRENQELQAKLKEATNPTSSGVQYIVIPETPRK